MSILWNPTEATVVEKVSLPVITTGTQNMGDGIYWLKAGTPLSNAYAVANNGNAKYIVAEDFFFVTTNPNQDRRVPLVKSGYVDIDKAEASAGITLADAAKSALKTAGIELVDGLLETGGGGSGGVVTAKVTYAYYNYSADVSYADLRAAYEAGKEIQLLYGTDVYKLAGVESNALVFSLIVVSNGSSATQKTFTYSSASLLGNSPSIEVASGYESDATEDSGTYTLADTADNLAGYVASMENVLIYIGDTVNGVGNYCPIVGMKQTASGDDDSSYAFYIVLNGSIVAFTAASSDAFPTYTP